MFTDVTIQNLRSLDNKNIQPKPGINIITGANGSGKTSLLEALYIITHGRSFRYREAAPLIREGTTEYILIAKFSSNHQTEHTIGIQRSKTDIKVRLDRKPLGRRSEIVHLLPVLCIDSEVQLLMTGGPELRRNFLDAGMFHMEPQYLMYYQQYHRALEQRNAALKSRQPVLSGWEEIMQQAAEKIDSWRQDYSAKLTQLVQHYMHEWQMDIELDIQYQRGWNKEINLIEALYKAYDTDIKMKYTSVGPHRADIVIRNQQTKSAKRLSRGQMKMVACALYFAQAILFRKQQQRNIILLFDDLSAELDNKNKGYLLQNIKKIFSQSFITVLNEQDITCITDVQHVFHMEHNFIDRSNLHKAI